MKTLPPCLGIDAVGATRRVAHRRAPGRGTPGAMSQPDFIGVRIRGTLGDIDPLNEVPFKGATTRTKKGPLKGVSLVLPRILNRVLRSLGPADPQRRFRV